MFDEPYLITAGGPRGFFQNNTTLYIYEKAFRAYDMGYASVLAAIFFIILILTLIPI